MYSLLYVAVGRVTSLSASGRSYGSTAPNHHDADAITYPDDISHDSYGNIVKPYKPLPDHTGPSAASAAYTSDVGLFTDVNKDKSQISASGIQFALPSYSDGILTAPSAIKPPTSAILPPPQQDLLPPLSSGNYNYPQLTTAQGAAAVSGHSPSSAAAAAAQPHQPDYQNEVNPYGNKGNTNAVAQKQHQPPTGTGSVRTDAFNQPNPIQIPTQSTVHFNALPSAPSNNNYPTSTGHQPSSVGQQNVPSHATTTTILSSQQYKPIVVGHQAAAVVSLPPPPPPQSSAAAAAQPGKYTGGFGGAPGVLGNQPNIGYAITTAPSKPTSSVTAPSLSPFPQAPEHDIKPTSTGSYGGHHGGSVATAPISSAPSTQYGTQNYGSNNALATFGGTIKAPSSSTSTHVPSAVVTPIHSTASSGSIHQDGSGKYTGGFGGPPGHLTPYDKPIPVAATSNSDG